MNFAPVFLPDEAGIKTTRSPEQVMRAYLSKTRAAGGSIKSRTPAEMLGRGPRPGVERSGTLG